MRIYTRTGDSGETSLFGGRRVPKSAARVEAYGSVDELNAHLGLLRAGIGQARALPEAERALWTSLLGRVQGWLLEVGALLATPPSSRAPVPDLAPGADAELERAIDALEKGLPPLRNFILPGGSVLGAQAHVARTVARRAERRVVALHQKEPLPEAVLALLNRLSDYLFVLARAVNHGLGSADEPWHPRRQEPTAPTGSQA
ncbi:cob(I)yrinic acid a,c-diamide adenosyltransferase [Limnochorda pilosa]|uniref:Corrinoid adenosyltransferase n=1 Tax=Limnochorda pilosa TaxID=1555112 RepID=A0A0K2SQ55_LIMPI|nr:cob(I)yrinic acid a,c-diamide adenosyltransferase [Limnochorda pilosa]BAS28964.1 cob(I)yrinic acid a c-diamide adenosyltransferase [Limnochorda pilosa]